MSQVKKGNLSNFPLLEEVTDEDKPLIPSLRKEIMNHLETLPKLFDEYFWLGVLETSEKMIISPYSFSFDNMSDYISLKDKLIELYQNRYFKCSLKQNSGTIFVLCN